MLVYLDIWFYTQDFGTLGKVWLFAADYRRSADLQPEHDKDSILHQGPDSALTTEGKDNKMHKARFHIFASEVGSPVRGSCICPLSMLTVPA